MRTPAFLPVLCREAGMVMMPAFRSTSDQSIGAIPMSSLPIISPFRIPVRRASLMAPIGKGDSSPGPSGRRGAPAAKAASISLRVSPRATSSRSLRFRSFLVSGLRAWPVTGLVFLGRTLHISAALNILDSTERTRLAWVGVCLPRRSKRVEMSPGVMSLATLWPKAGTMIKLTRRIWCLAVLVLFFRRM